MQRNIVCMLQRMYKAQIDFMRWRNLFHVVNIKKEGHSGVSLRGPISVAWLIELKSANSFLKGPRTCMLSKIHST